MDERRTAPSYPNPSQNGQPHRAINWGGVLKGVAIVAAVVVVGFVAYSAVSGIAGAATAAIVGNATASSALAGISNTAASVWESIQWGAGYAWGQLGLAMDWLIKAVGFEGLKWTGAATTTNVLGIAGAGAATAVAAHAAIPAISNTQLSTTVPADIPPSAPAPSIESGLLAAQGAQNIHTASHSALHEVAHAAHHAAESNNEVAENNWSRKFAHKTAYASHADAARATAAARTVPQPADTFSAQLNADRSNLDAALAK